MKSKKIRKVKGAEVTDIFEFLNWLDRFTSNILSLIGSKAELVVDAYDGQVVVSLMERKSRSMTLEELEEFNKEISALSLVAASGYLEPVDILSRLNQLVSLEE